jgi:hypothetical protein
MHESHFHRAQHESRRQETLEEKIEKLALPHEYKTNVLLVWSGAKPAGILSIKDTPERAHEIAVMENQLQQFDIQVYSEPYTNDAGEKWIQFYFSRDKSLPEKVSLMRRSMKIHSPAWHQEFGRMCGYPRTAVYAFVNRQEMIDGVPPKWQSTELGRFFEHAIGFKLSKQHADQELKEINRWRTSLKNTAPHYYEELMQSIPENKMQ